MSRGKIVVEGTPEELKRGLRGEAVSVRLADSDRVRAEAVVGLLEGVHETTVDGEVLRMRVDSGARAIPSILSALESNGIAVEAVASHRPSLDDVYLHYTGYEFDEDDRAVNGKSA